MGVDVDAEIMYGMVLYDEDETYVEVPWRNDDSDDEDFESWVVQQLGLEPLDYSDYPKQLPYDRAIPYEARRAQEKKEHEEWSKRVGSEAHHEKRRELLATVPVEEASGGTDQWRVTLLRLKGPPVIRASYSPQVFDPMTLLVSDDSAAIAFLEPYGVKWVGEWLLVPSYG